LTYTCKDGSVNGIVREYAPDGQQIMEITVKNGHPKYHTTCWFLENGKRVTKVVGSGAELFDLSPRSTVVETRYRKCISKKHYNSSGKVIDFELVPIHTDGDIPDGKYVEYFEGSKQKRASYCFRKGKLNGHYYEYDDRGRDVLLAGVKNGVLNGLASFYEYGKLAYKYFRNNKMYDVALTSMSKAVVHKVYDRKKLIYFLVSPKGFRDIPDMDVSDHPVSGDQKILAKYSLKNRKVNGIYREFDKNGQQIMEIPIVNNRASGSGWYIDDRNIRLEATFKKGAIIEL